MKKYLRVIKVPVLIEVVGIVLAVAVTMALASTGLEWTMGIGVAIPGGAAVAAFFQLVHNCRDHNLRLRDTWLVLSGFYFGHLYALWMVYCWSEGLFRQDLGEIVVALLILIVSWAIPCLLLGGLTVLLYRADINRSSKHKGRVTPVSG